MNKTFDDHNLFISQTCQRRSKIKIRDTYNFLNNDPNSKIISANETSHYFNQFMAHHSKLLQSNQQSQENISPFKQQETKSPQNNQGLLFKRVNKGRSLATCFIPRNLVPLQYIFSIPKEKSGLFGSRKNSKVKTQVTQSTNVVEEDLHQIVNVGSIGGKTAERKLLMFLQQKQMKQSSDQYATTEAIQEKITKNNFSIQNFRQIKHKTESDSYPVIIPEISRVLELSKTQPPVELERDCSQDQQKILQVSPKQLCQYPSLIEQYTKVFTRKPKRVQNFNLSRKKEVKSMNISNVTLKEDLKPQIDDQNSVLSKEKGMVSANLGSKFRCAGGRYQECDTEEKIYTMYNYLEVIEGQVASLTKIMTCFIAIQLIEEQNLDSEKIYFQVPRFASRLNGTSANLKQDQIISLYDLLFGMMLPSGNDAATVISEGLGLFLHYKSIDRDLVNDEIYELKKELDLFNDAPHYADKPQQFTDFFIDEMNKWVQKLGMNQSYFASPHGLANRKNVSCARDIALLSYEAMKYPLFRKIVSTKQHNYTIRKKLSDGTYDHMEMNWTNTNRLLDCGFNGIKTGNTDVAGPCLAASTTIQTLRGSKELVIVVIRSRTEESRFQDVIKLVNWAKHFYLK